jgi:UDP-N-acetyl-D-mannosaminuronate dehydrogenase
MSNENNAMFNRIAMIGLGDIGLPTHPLCLTR